MTFRISQRGKQYLETARTLLRAAQTMTDEAIAGQLKALADEYQRRAEQASHVDSALFRKWLSRLKVNVGWLWCLFQRSSSSYSLDLLCSYIVRRQPRLSGRLVAGFQGEMSLTIDGGRGHQRLKRPCLAACSSCSTRLNSACRWCPHCSVALQTVIFLTSVAASSLILFVLA